MSYIEYLYGIAEDKVMYFKTNRFYPDDKYLNYANKMIGKKEIVSLFGYFFRISCISSLSTINFKNSCWHNDYTKNAYISYTPCNRIVFCYYYTYFCFYCLF